MWLLRSTRDRQETPPTCEDEWRIIVSALGGRRALQSLSLYFYTLSDSLNQKYFQKFHFPISWCILLLHSYSQEWKEPRNVDVIDERIYIFNIYNYIKLKVKWQKKSTYDWVGIISNIMIYLLINWVTNYLAVNAS